MDRCARLAVSIALAIWAGAVDAAPYVPDDDAIVLERLPEKTDPSLKELRRIRAALAADPRNLEAALAVARRAIEASRSTGDPRFLGQAQAALAPWWSDDAPPAQALLLRATLKQSQHDFAGALEDLDRLLERTPADAQALLTRATVRTVTGRYAAARSDCARIAQRASALIVTACLAAPASLRGHAETAYRALATSLNRPGDPSGVRVWASTLAGEMAARLGDRARAEAHFKEALALDPRDSYLRAAYADFLLDLRRAEEVLPLVRDDVQNDSLLLRLALAERMLPGERAAFDAHRALLAARCDAARARGDTLHRREEARFRLEIEADAAGALALARANWDVQREPADLRILSAAADAASDDAAKRIVREWIAANKLEDVTLVASVK
jgi:tetratricopeptide (TPR) repeat protein